MFRRILLGFAAVLAVTLMAGAFVAGAFSDDDTSSGNPGGVAGSPSDEAMERQPAPIEEARIKPANIGGSDAVVGIAGLPGGCAETDGFEVTQDGTNIKVEVYNLVPSDGRPCTMIYGTYPIAIGLGSDIEPGVEYTVDVNGTLLTFVA